jgi:DNA-binding GntR family transcriptional regulator
LLPEDLVATVVYDLSLCRVRLGVRALRIRQDIQYYVYRILSPYMTAIQRSPLRDEVYRRILDAIHRGTHAPGSRIRDSALAVELGVSRTPVREALLRLAREGVLDSDMGKGFRVPPLDAAEIGDIGQIVGALESLALQLTPDFTREQLDRLAELDRQLEHTRGDATRCVGLEDEWHTVLLERCPNRRLLDLIGDLRQISGRYLAAYVRDSQRMALSTLPHQRILAALREGDRDGVLRAFFQQWRRGIDELQAWIARPKPPAGKKVAAR